MRKSIFLIMVIPLLAFLSSCSWGQKTKGIEGKRMGESSSESAEELNINVSNGCRVSISINYLNESPDQTSKAEEVHQSLSSSEIFTESVIDHLPMGSETAKQWALSIEAELKKLGAKQFCNSPDAEFRVNLILTELSFYGKEAADRTGYGNVKLNKYAREINANFSWRPRRMLIDQYMMHNDLHDPIDAFPVNISQFTSFAAQYSEFMVATRDSEYVDFIKRPEHSKYPEDPEQHREYMGVIHDKYMDFIQETKPYAELQEKIPEDILWLFTRSPQLTRPPFGGHARFALDNMLERSQPGYSLIAKRIINDGMSEASHNEILDIGDIKDSKILNIYNIKLDYYK